MAAERKGALLVHPSHPSPTSTLFSLPCCTLFEYLIQKEIQYYKDDMVAIKIILYVCADQRTLEHCLIQGFF